MFVGRIVAVAALVAVGVVRAQAQDPPRVEIAFETGYTASEGIQTRRRESSEGRSTTISTSRAARISGFLAGVYVTPNAEVEFLWNRQLSQFDASNPAPSQLLADVSVDNYHGNFVYNWFESDAKVRPFLFGGIGATHYSPGDPVSLPKVTSATGIDSATKFSFTWGGGVKLYPTPHFGVRLSARWTPTYIKSDAGGIWCDPHYGPVLGAGRSGLLEPVCDQRGRDVQVRLRLNRGQGHKGDNGQTGSVTLVSFVFAQPRESAALSAGWLSYRNRLAPAETACVLRAPVESPARGRWRCGASPRAGERADVARGGDERRIVAHGQEDDARRVRGFGEPRGRVETAHHRHRDVEDDDVRLEDDGRVERRPSVAHRADDVEFLGDRWIGALEHRRMIVGENHARSGHEW